MRRTGRIVIAVLSTMLPLAAMAHGPVPRVPESDASTARLFSADSATGEVIVVDLPSGEVVTRLATPPYIILLTLSGDGRHVVAMRGRSTDRDTITFIDSGFDPSRQVRFPTIVRTFAANAPGGEHDGRLFSVDGRDAIVQEGAAEMDIFDAANFGSTGAVQISQIKLAAPDHYHYLEAGKYLYVGHLARGFVQIIDRDTGTEAGRIGNCPVLHGAAKDEESGRLFFGCINGVLVVGTKGAELNQEVARIPYPSKQRVATFMKGEGRILWGKTEGAIPALQRLDLKKKTYAFESVPVDDSIQQATTEDGSRLLIYSRNGNLDIRDGGTGGRARSISRFPAHSPPTITSTWTRPCCPASCLPGTAHGSRFLPRACSSRSISRPARWCGGSRRAGSPRGWCWYALRPRDPRRRARASPTPRRPAGWRR